MTQKGQTSPHTPAKTPTRLCKSSWETENVRTALARGRTAWGPVLAASLNGGTDTGSGREGAAGFVLGYAGTYEASNERH